MIYLFVILTVILISLLSMANKELDKVYYNIANLRAIAKRDTVVSNEKIIAICSILLKERQR
jgi:hypothetical protein